MLLLMTTMQHACRRTTDDGRRKTDDDDDDDANDDDATAEYVIAETDEGLKKRFNQIFIEFTRTKEHGPELNVLLD